MTETTGIVAGFLMSTTPQSTCPAQAFTRIYLGLGLSLSDHAILRQVIEAGARGLSVDCLRINTLPVALSFQQQIRITVCVEEERQAAKRSSAGGRAQHRHLFFLGETCIPQKRNVTPTRNLCGCHLLLVRGRHGRQNWPRSKAGHATRKNKKSIIIWTHGNTWLWRRPMLIMLQLAKTASHDRHKQKSSSSWRLKGEDECNDRVLLNILLLLSDLRNKWTVELVKPRRERLKPSQRTRTPW